MAHKRFIYSENALIQMRKRNLDFQFIDVVLDFPDNVLVGNPEIIVYQKMGTDNNKLYLYRVFVNIHKRPPVIVTVYKTSKIDKYEDQV